MSADGLKIATYEFGDPDAPTVLAVHGFASSALLNWQASGWVRDLTRAGFRVIAIDQRGHGASDKPHDPRLYSIKLLVADILSILDTFMLDEVDYVGYSLGARVGWRAAAAMPSRIRRAVLGGIPDGDPLTEFDITEARNHISDGTEVIDHLTGVYLRMAQGIPGNDLTALVALVEGLRGDIAPDAAGAPNQEMLFATGSDDPILAGSRSLAATAPHATFVEIPGRNHFTAPTSREFRRAAIGFLDQPA
jgi:pimeloyl-ACP methyl ester carboxylesterase